MAIMSMARDDLALQARGVFRNLQQRILVCLQGRDLTTTGTLEQAWPDRGESVELVSIFKRRNLKRRRGQRSDCGLGSRRSQCRNISFMRG